MHFKKGECDAHILNIINISLKDDRMMVFPHFLDSHEMLNCSCNLMLT